MENKNEKNYPEYNHERHNMENDIYNNINNAKDNIPKNIDENEKINNNSEIIDLNDIELGITKPFTHKYYSHIKCFRISWLIKIDQG